MHYEKMEEESEKMEEESDTIGTSAKVMEYSIAMDENSSRNYIHEITMQTMVNRDVIRKIKERKESVEANSEREMGIYQIQEMVRELWEITQTRDFSMDMDSGYPYELQKSFNEFVSQSRLYLEKHPLFSTPPLPFQKEMENNGKMTGHEKGEEDTKEIHMLPVFMEKQHPLWNYNNFNRKKASHAYPPNSKYHIPTANLGEGGVWRKDNDQYRNQYRDTIFEED